MEKKNYLKGYTLFLIGLFIGSVGIALSTKAGLGTSPVSSLPYSISLILPIMTFGMWCNVMSVIQISTQVILLKGKVNWLEIAIQTALAFFNGYLVDIACAMIAGLAVTSYAQKLIMCLASCFILGFGIWVQLKGGVAMLPGEAMNRAIAIVTGKNYADIKVFFDVLYILISSVICLLAFGKLVGVREGSIIAALLIGNVIKWYSKLWDKLTKKV